MLLNLDVIAWSNCDSDARTTLFENTIDFRARHFVSTFHTPSYSIWAKIDEKCLQNVLAECVSAFQNLRLGSIHL